jgi:hypothetical protein
MNVCGNWRKEEIFMNVGIRRGEVRSHEDVWLDMRMAMDD